MKDGQTIAELLNWNFEIYGALKIYNKNNQKIYFQASDSGYWTKREWDSYGNQIYFEDSTGVIIDHRTPEVIEHNGRKYQLIP